MSARRGSVMMRLLLSVVVVASLFGVACCGDGDGGGGGGGGGGAEPPPSLVNVYLEPSAQGYALVESCNYPSQGLAPVGLKVNIGDMFPWDSATVVVGCKATNKGATDPETVVWSVSHDYYGSGKVYDTGIQVSFSSGGVPFGG